MINDKLIATGLSEHQAKGYLFLLEKGSANPPDAARQLKLSRTNAYKLLDKLVELGLAIKLEEDKKLVYRPNNPTSLSSLADQYRSEATAREEATNNVIHELLEKYNKNSDKPSVRVFSGNKGVAAAYRRQINLKEDIYFIRTNADIAAMGFDAMHEIRIAPGRNGNQRFGILGIDKGPINFDSHRRSNLKATIMNQKNYTAPIEWSVTNSSLLIVTYAREPQAILIIDPHISRAFKQLWKLFNIYLEALPFHQKHKERKVN